MTIAAGFRFDKGVLICADTQNTYAGVLKIDDSKIFSVELNSCKLAFAYSGTIAYAKMFLEKCAYELRDLEEGGGDRLSFLSIRGTIEKQLLKMYSDYIFPHPEFRRGGPEFDAVIGIYVDGQTHLLSTTETAVNEVDNYFCVGAGTYMAHYIIRSIYQHSKMRLGDIVNLAIHSLKEVKKNVDSCGGHSQFLVLKNDGEVSNTGNFDIAETEQISEALRQISRRIFLLCADLSTPEEEIKKEFDDMHSIVTSCRKVQISEKNSWNALKVALGENKNSRIGNQQ